MKKRTHLRVVKYFSKELSLSNRSRFFLYLGSIAPDLTPFCFIKPHRYNSNKSNIIKKFSMLNFSKRDYLLFYQVGIICHYSADFFTLPHNNEGIIGFCKRHRSYETKLDKFFKDNLYFVKFSSFKYNNFEKYLTTLHNSYSYDNKCLRNDFNYICLVTNFIISKLKDDC